MTATVEQLEREAREEGARRMTNIERSITDMRKDINALTVTLARIDSNTVSNSKMDTDIDDLKQSRDRLWGAIYLLAACVGIIKMFFSH
jgi:hypothetical protein